MLDMTEFEYVIRMLVAAVCGIVIGYERKSRAKEAGVRTHCVVACASALMMVLSKYAYEDVLGEFVGLDPSRVAAGVASGIGFLGAGMILVHKKTVIGLTTAAGLWATAGIGMAIGAGMYIVGASAALIILAVQVVLHLSPRHPGAERDSGPGQFTGAEQLLKMLEETGIQILEAGQCREEKEGKPVYTVRVTLPSNLEEKDGAAAQQH